MLLIENKYTIIVQGGRCNARLFLLALQIESTSKSSFVR